MAFLENTNFNKRQTEKNMKFFESQIQIFDAVESFGLSNKKVSNVREHQYALSLSLYFQEALRL